MSTSPHADVNDIQTAARSLVLDVLRRRASGESLPDEKVIASRPDLAEHIRAELDKLELICAAGLAADENNRNAGADPMAVTADLRADRTPGMLQFQCPHCREPFETATDTPVTEILCSTCGGHFSLAGESKETRTSPSLQSLAHFDLVERLGVGGFGTVWKARDRKLDRTVAVKIPRQGILNNDETEKFLREARAAAQLQHPNIVRVYEVGRDGDSVFIVSDFVRGIPLDEWLTGQQPTMRQAAEICTVIAEALQHAHDRGVIHRDLKPANILIDADGRPHLTDFGLARRQVGEITLTLDGQVLGTPAYMSPEQAKGEAHTADARSDVYSLGAILFQLLTGELPFRGSARMLMHQVIHDEPPSPRSLNSHVPRDLETITLKCLEKDGENRYQSAKDLESDLCRWLAGGPVAARPIGQLRRCWRWYVRRTDLIAGAFTLFNATFTVASSIPLPLMLLIQEWGLPRSNWNWSDLAEIGAGISFVLAVISIFAWSGVLSMRGRKLGLVLSSVLFGLMSLSSIFSSIIGYQANGQLAVFIITGQVPLCAMFVLGFILQIVALVQRLPKHLERISLAQTKQPPSIIEKAYRWWNRSPGAASAVTWFVVFGITAVASSGAWLAFHSLTVSITSQSMAAPEGARPAKKGTGSEVKTNSFPSLVEPPTAELRKRIGSKQTVLMRVARAQLSPRKDRLFLNSMWDYKDPKCFTITIGKEHLAKLNELDVTKPDIQLIKVVLRVTGEITELAGRVEIQVDDPKRQLEILRNYGEPSR